MDRVSQYRRALREIMERYAGYSRRAIPPAPGVESFVVADGERDQYGLLRVGWRDGKRERHFVFYARLAGGKVWIEEDNTDATLADELLKAGVPKEDIVLAFHPPELRHLTEFAVA